MNRLKELYLQIQNRETIKPNEMKKVAVIIKHPYRDNDWRIDIYEIPEEMNNDELENYVNAQMLGPFEIIAITEKISFNRKIEKKLIELK